MGANRGKWLVENALRQLLLVALLASRVVLPQATTSFNMDADSTECGNERISLSAAHPEFVLRFPAQFTRDLLSIIAGERAHVVDTPPLDSRVNHTLDDDTTDLNTFTYRCHWMVTTDSLRKISADFKFESGRGFLLTAEDDLGFITNCTREHCLIESVSPALSLQFSAQADSAYPVRFSAKLYSTLAHRTDSGSEAVTWWILLLVLFVVLFVFTSISYLTYMKRKLLLARIFRLLSNSDGSSKPQSKKKLTLANGTQVPVGSCRRQHRTSVTSSHLSHFEPMPTIAEEDVEVAECDEAAASYLGHSSMRQQPAY